MVIISLRALPSFSMRICEQIRKHSTASILLIGGSKNMNIVHKAITLQVSDYLPDPYDAQDLEVCLANLRSSIRRQEKAAGQSSSALYNH